MLMRDHGISNRKNLHFARPSTDLTTEDTIVVQRLVPRARKAYIKFETQDSINERLMMQALIKQFSLQGLFNLI